MNLGLEIKRLRNNQNLTQLQLSQKLFIDVATLSKYERGLRKVRTQFFLNTLLVLNIKPGMYLKNLRLKHSISIEKLSKITLMDLNDIKLIEDYKNTDMNHLTQVFDRLFIYIKTIEKENPIQYCFAIGDIISLSDSDEWCDISEEDRSPSARFKVLSREIDNDDYSQYYTAISLQTNEIFEGYASHFNTI